MAALKTGEFLISGVDGNLTVSTRSQFTGKVNTMTLAITQAQMDRFCRREALIQNIFPDLPANEREFLITGTTQEEWAQVFGKGKED